MRRMIIMMAEHQDPPSTHSLMPGKPPQAAQGPSSMPDSHPSTRRGDTALELSSWKSNRNHLWWENFADHR